MQKFAQESQDTKQGNRMAESAAAEESEDETEGTEYKQYGTIGSMLVEEDMTARVRCRIRKQGIVLVYKKHLLPY
jgi:hypothetical protein